jgi:hypothetical protein
MIDENTKSSMDWTNKQMLEEALSVCEKDDPDKMIVLFLWDGKGNYHHRFMQTGMKCSEMIALLEVNKQKLIRMMEEE